MNTNGSNQLIDEEDVRAAVRFFDFDREAFDRSVRQRVEQGVQSQASTTLASAPEMSNKFDRGGLLRIAASVVPFHLLGGGTAAAQVPAVQTAISPAALSAVGGLKKAVSLIAIPALSLLMISVSIVSLIRIRKSQQSKTADDFDALQVREAISSWWRQHGLIAGGVFALAIVAPFFGWTVALLIVFIASALAAASLVVMLGKAGLVDRRAVASCCIPVLGILGQLSLGFATINRTALLDPILVTVVCFAGAGMIASLIPPFPDAQNSTGSLWGRRIAFALACGIIVVFGTQTLWRPIRTDSMIRYVENFQTDLLGHWRTWEVTANWLIDQEIDFDRTHVQSHLQSSIASTKNKRYLLGTAVSTGLISASQLIEDEDVVANRERLLDAKTIDRAIGSVRQFEFVISVLADSGDLTPSEREHLVSRLMATWSELGDAYDGADVFEDAEVVTNLLIKLDKNPKFAKRQEDVRGWLSKYQNRESRVFLPSGGFMKYPAMKASDPYATAAAVRLMHHYGGGDVIDVLALRSFLRPKVHFGLLTDTEMMRASTLERLNRVDGIASPTVWDHFVRDQSLWFAIAVGGLCLCATLGAPNLQASRP